MDLNILLDNTFRTSSTVAACHIPPSKSLRYKDLDLNRVERSRAQLTYGKNLEVLNCWKINTCFAGKRVADVGPGRSLRGRDD
ncbi:uncharacterized protein PHALS_10342 [Plasmopara halstedii]|uniref:Uncharacterized protein n=1 Tax=Plasmopara halstedii TaxID=4781 RepID=A0A0P1AI08_PLAHL|nr:uncharacterized protein PHALS_10342 [Plasmopara halstedii]CEG40125.1 hypothetical protein PHALS_10342 [Plasmopara halstedii]|eukprot:XP_024576494.1 hypothetical protein PHALS_10342 [Plasmopara halstedii]